MGQGTGQKRGRNWPHLSRGRFHRWSGRALAGAFDQRQLGLRRAVRIPAVRRLELEADLNLGVFEYSVTSRPLMADHQGNPDFSRLGYPNRVAIAVQDVKCSSHGWRSPGT